MTVHDSDSAPLDRLYMDRALALAQAAAAVGEVPVGAVIVDPDGKIIGEAANAPIKQHDPTAHAEILAIRSACIVSKNYRLPGHTLYVTLEPCTMCASAISNARITRVVYGASDPKGGAVESGVQFFGSPTCHHRPEVTSGLRAEAVAQILRDFFRARRK
ncbi:tRNA-specific adenosine deaminase [Algimonas arctica]|uniref:tRNA-specific adenosine deaminase n=1 Tax=Algimonas arctica TaxID=1479486 RepID=A0A8J3CTK1_9PROT|nr:tRNA adenosine(34) deaminase TadA [Algimonas arctica]GHA98836.1 tRNA-specific adenosine deaminase [Algimonas arctica]